MTSDLFRTELDKHINADFSRIKSIYSQQQLRVGVLGTLAILAIFIGLGTFFPFLILVFLVLAWIVYSFIFSMWRNKARIDADEDLQRIILKGVAKTTKQPFSLLTHCSHPKSAFTDSKLFSFKADEYSAEELLEIKGANLVHASMIKAEEHIDAFERDGKDESSFEGWLIEIKSNSASESFASKLAALNFNLLKNVEAEGSSWLAVPFKESLYKKSFFHLGVNYNSCYKLYQVLNSVSN